MHVIRTYLKGTASPQEKQASRLGQHRLLSIYIYIYEYY